MSLLNFNSFDNCGIIILKNMTTKFDSTYRNSFYARELNASPLVPA